MSKRNKLQKFAELLSYPNVFENFNPRQPGLIGAGGESVKLRGSWNANYFENDHPITLELACGRGEYTINLAKQYPDRNFIGMDVKGARIWKGATIALQEGLKNVAFIRTRIEQIALFFEPAEVAEIWITFPDPFLRKSKANRRLTSSAFLNRYRQVLRSGGVVHLKTDEPQLFDFTLETLEQTPYAVLEYADDDIYAHALPLPELDFKTYYEHMHLAAQKTIKYIRIRLEGDSPLPNEALG